MDPSRIRSRFYSDLLLAFKAKLISPGQTAYVPRATPNPWADGQRVLLGQDAVDFLMKVEAVNPVEHTATVLIQHVPPSVLCVQLPMKWMQEVSTENPNNFVQVSGEGDEYVAEAGKETFDVRLIVDTRDGRMLSAVMRNVLVLTTRTCKDREATQCGPTALKTILREVSWRLVP